MGSRPEELRSEIDTTREELAYDVDRLADRTVPSRVAGRKWEGAKSRVRSVSDRVMGARDQARDQAQDAAHSVADTVRQAPDTVVRQTRGNPIAVGLIAFGVGLLAASLLPETEAEKRAGAAVTEHSGDLVDKVRETAREVADDLGGTAREAAGQVTETAREAARHTAEQAKESGRSTVDQTRESVR